MLSAAILIQYGAISEEKTDCVAPTSLCVLKIAGIVLNKAILHL